MKKLILIMLCLLVAGGVARADKYTIDRDALPEPAREMLDKYFPNKKVGMIKVDRHLLRKTDYDVRLTDGTKIEFNNAGKWTSVKMKKGAVPSGLMLRAMRTYINKNYKDVSVVWIEKNRTSGAYKVGLSDGVELRFTALGAFKSVELND
ncbi:MAG: PepSY-like domain-containing protein [Muribaculaceae bacterium]|nr:PepSY-like domain-containing protein [Muribaculaceae bacterium]